MKKVMMVLAAAASLAAGAAEKMLVLPPAEKSGGIPLYTALAKRHTVRKFKAQKPSRQQLANLLWCANGVNREDGKRTAPSARNRQEIMIYVAIEDGAYLYDAQAHALVKVSDVDLRRACGRYTAPCYLVLVADRARQEKDEWAWTDSGYVSQNIYLAAEAGGLGTCAMGMIVNRDLLKKELKLGGNTLTLVHPVGVPE